MRLSAAEVIPYALPFKRPYVTARGVLQRREMVLLRVRDEDGIVGLGEAVPLALRGGAGLMQVVRELEAWAERVEAAEGQEGEGLSAPARCAVVTARMDLLGRRAGDSGDQRTHNPSVAAPTESVPCNATLVAGEPSAVAGEAERWAADGFTTFKLKLGAETAKTRAVQGFLRSRGNDVEQVRAVRGALGDSVRIRVDVNAAWDLETAKRALAELETFGIELAEQPVATLEEMAELAASTSIPLAADESVASLDEAERAVAMGACTYTGIKLSKVGGPERALAIADVLPAYISSALDGPVGMAAGAQVALSLAEHPERLELAHGLATQRLFASTIASVECELRDGVLHLPPGPGLGVEIDEEALQAHRL
ncbi:MAG TPA: mandelate racemase/muconate lactonizing enzyme family protein [Solirubrobacterales bacterium]|nr:mandelate racemase/muconate lactonizing enzyme family protein [Solirubrobacterales bacterium]